MERTEKIRKQAPSSVFMVRPLGFGYNSETAESNAFQHNDGAENTKEIASEATKEFDAFVQKLRNFGINVLVFDQDLSKNTPDAVFPNNWISFHEDGTLALYPMMAENRRIERRKDIVNLIATQFTVTKKLDYSPNEKKGKIVEGTGSIIFDHINKVAYANESPRTDKQLFYQICDELGYYPMLFPAVDANGQEIYHTNVMMALGADFAVICLESIPELNRSEVKKKLVETGHEIINITYGQMDHFAGNMIQLTNNEGEPVLVMSQSAYDSLNSKQLSTLEKYNRILSADLSTIEKYGGGSARCMIGGIHLPKN